MRQIDAVIIFAIVAAFFLLFREDHKNECWLTHFNSCSESLNWDEEFEAGENEKVCDELAVKLCDGYITPDEHRAEVLKLMR